VTVRQFFTVFFASLLAGCVGTGAGPGASEPSPPPQEAQADLGDQDDNRSFPDGWVDYSALDGDEEYILRTWYPGFLDDTTVQGQDALRLSRPHTEAGHDHPIVGMAFSIVAAVDGSCLPRVMNVWRAVQDRDFMQCPTVEVGQIQVVGSGADSIYRFETRHDCTCTDRVPMIVRSLAFMSDDIPDTCLMVSGYWPVEDDSDMTTIMESMAFDATLSESSGE